MENKKQSICLAGKTPEKRLGKAFRAQRSYPAQKPKLSAHPWCAKAKQEKPGLKPEEFYAVS